MLNSSRKSPRILVEIKDQKFQEVLFCKLILKGRLMVSYPSMGELWISYGNMHNVEDIHL